MFPGRRGEERGVYESRASRLDPPAGRKADPIIIPTLPGSSVLCLPAPPAVGTGVGRQGWGSFIPSSPILNAESRARKEVSDRSETYLKNLLDFCFWVS